MLTILAAVVVLLLLVLCCVRLAEAADNALLWYELTREDALESKPLADDSDPAGDAPGSAAGIPPAA